MQKKDKRKKLQEYLEGIEDPKLKNIIIGVLDLNTNILSGKDLSNAVKKVIQKIDNENK